MAPLVSPFCSPLSSTILERAGVPAGKQSRPIAPLPYPKWTNRSPPRRAKMNGSLSPHWLASLWSSLLPMFPALSSFLFNCGCLSLALASLHHALALRPCHTFLSALLFSFLCARHRSTLFSAFSFASAVLFTTLPYTLTLLCSLRSSRTIYFLFLFSPCFVSLSLSLSLFFSNLCSSPSAHFFRSFSSLLFLLFRALLSSQPAVFSKISLARVYPFFLSSESPSFLHISYFVSYLDS